MKIYTIVTNIINPEFIMWLLGKIFWGKNHDNQIINIDNSGINHHFQIKENKGEKVRNEIIKSLFDNAIEIIFWKKKEKRITQNEKDELYNDLKDYLIPFHQEYPRNKEFSLKEAQKKSTLFSSIKKHTNFF